MCICVIRYNFRDGFRNVEKSHGHSLAWGMEHGLCDLMTHMVVWLGTTWFTVQYALGQGTADLFLKQFWSYAGALGKQDTKVLSSFYKAEKGNDKSEVLEPLNYTALICFTCGSI